MTDSLSANSLQKTLLIHRFMDLSCYIFPHLFPLAGAAPSGIMRIVAVRVRSRMRNMRIVAPWQAAGRPGDWPNSLWRLESNDTGADSRFFLSAS